ncbi:hypothetical protein G7046_g5685 [Stylonectria norvegica]|nr:hypothetical protein G7046_g5685 [Stylonectria norvegica]
MAPRWRKLELESWIKPKPPTDQPTPPTSPLKLSPKLSKPRANSKLGQPWRRQCRSDPVNSTTDEAKLAARVERDSFLRQEESILKVKKTYCVKTSRVAIPAAMAVHWLRENTDIPVPRMVYYRTDTYLYFHCYVFEKPPGERLDHMWDKLSVLERTAILDQLKTYVDTIRKIDEVHLRLVRPKDWFVSPMSDQYISNATELIWAMSVRTFEQPHKLSSPTAREEVLKSLGHIRNISLAAKMVFTHGLLLPKSILITSDAKISAIINWDEVGYAPEFWEHTKIFTMLEGHEATY